MKFLCGKYLLGLVVVLASLQSCPTLLHAQTPAEILDGYRAAVSRLSFAKYDALVNLYEDGGVFERETWLKAQELTTVSIGEDWRQKFRDRTCLQIGGRQRL